MNTPKTCLNCNSKRLFYVRIDQDWDTGSIVRANNDTHYNNNDPNFGDDALGYGEWKNYSSDMFGTYCSNCEYDDVSPITI